MRRRAFVAALLATVAMPRGASAQTIGKPARIGILTSSPGRPIERFRRKLQELGYVEGESVTLEYRFADGREDRLPALAAELVALKVDVLVPWGTPAALAAKQATSTIPIVIGAMGDILSTGVVTNLARPGGNITGFSSMNVELDEKRLELLSELLPGFARLSVLANSANPLNDFIVARLRRAAESWRVSLDLVAIGNADELTEALRRLVEARPDGVLVVPDLLLLSKRTEIVEAMARARLPAVYAFREYAEAGGLMSYGADVGALFERAAVYVDKILKGSRPGDLPMQQATALELVVNLGAARSLGLAPPPAFLARADEVIE
jgi:putative ABC transport system substrate-binding protein